MENENIVKKEKVIKVPKKVEITYLRKGDFVYIVTSDGRIVGELSTGDKLVLEVPHAVTKLIKLSDIGFYERMREKLNGD